MRFLILTFIFTAHSFGQLLGPNSVFTVSGAIVNVRSANVSGSGASISVPIGLYTRSNLIVSCVAYDSNVTITSAVLEQLGGAASLPMTIDVNNRIGTTSGNVSCAIASAIMTNDLQNAAAAVTWTFSGAIGAAAGTAREIIGAWSFDKFSTNSGTGTAPTSNATPLTTSANEIAIGCIAIEGPNTDAPGTWDNLRKGERAGTNSGGAAANCTIEEGFLELATTGTSVAKKTGITSRDWAAAVATYKIR